MKQMKGTEFRTSFLPKDIANRADAELNGAKPAMKSSRFAPISLLPIILLLTGGIRAETVTANFASEEDVPLSVSSYLASGREIEFSLNFDPTPGTDFTVIENTGPDPISGVFSNLSEGQTAVIEHTGKRYSFIATYSGGDGNDLVLLWKKRRIAAFHDSPDSEEDRTSPVEASSSTPSFFLLTRSDGALEGESPVEFYASEFENFAQEWLSFTKLSNGQWLRRSAATNSIAAPFELPEAFAGKSIHSIASDNIGTFLVLCSDGTLLQWFVDPYAGPGPDPDPIVVSGTGALAGKVVTQIACSGYHFLALCSDGVLAAWGDNSSGQLGDGSVESSDIPVQVVSSGALGGQQIAHIYASDGFSAALTASGTLFTWGVGPMGREGYEATLVPTPVDGSGVLAGKQVVDFAVSSSGSALVLCSDQTVATWGPLSLWDSESSAYLESQVPVLVHQPNLGLGESIQSVTTVPHGNFLLTNQGRMFGWPTWSEVFGEADPSGTIIPDLFEITGELSGSRFIALPPHGIVALPLGSNPRLATLSINGGHLSQDLHPACFHYEAQLVNGSTSVQITATTEDPDCEITVNGSPQAGGTTSPQIPVDPGVTTIEVRSTAPDGTSETYSIEFLAPPTFGDVDLDGQPAISAPVIDASGQLIDFHLTSAPQPGSVFTVVENQGLLPIHGRFAGLEQGEIIGLGFEGKTYHFIVNYYGGNGNDLVLEWAGRKVVTWGGNYRGDGSHFPSTARLDLGLTGPFSEKVVLQVASGDRHCLVLCTDGSLYTWGLNQDGVVGDPNYSQYPYPVPFEPAGALAGKQVVAIDCGDHHSVALCSDGTVATWGSNADYQLGDGTQSSQATPIPLDYSATAPNTTVLSIKAAGNSTSLLFSNGRILSLGRLGIGGQRLYPSRGPLADEVVHQIAISDLNGYAISSDGKAWGWGSSTNQYVAADFTLPPEDSFEISELTDSATLPIRQLAAGPFYGFAVDSDGRVFNWGANEKNQLARATTAEFVALAEVPFTSYCQPSELGMIATGFGTSFAVTSTGRGLAWGDNSEARFGDGTQTSNTFGPSWVPTTLPLEDSPLMAVDVGDTVAALAAVEPSSELRIMEVSAGYLSPAFSSDVHEYVLNVPSGTSEVDLHLVPAYLPASILIDGVPYDPSVPFPTIGNPEPKDIVVSGGEGNPQHYSIRVVSDIHHTFASADEPAISLNGYHAGGYDATFSLDFAPSTGASLTVIDNTGMQPIDGRFNGLPQWAPVPLGYGGKTYQFVANYHGGDGNDLVLEWAERELILWGRNSNGMLLTGDLSDRAIPVAPIEMGALAGRTVHSVACGGFHCVALCTNGDIVVWGSGPAAESATPYLLTGRGALDGKVAVAISASHGNAMALCDDGTVVTWGDNSDYQLLGASFSTASSFDPIASNAGGTLEDKEIVSISCGGRHCMVLDSEGTAYCWGTGPGGLRSSLARQVSTTFGSSTADPKIIQSIATGYDHSLAVCTDGTLIGWGSNAHGELAGPGSTWNNPSIITPRDDLTGKTVDRFVNGPEHFTMALCEDGTIVTWGRNEALQLGTAHTENIGSLPTEVVLNGSLQGKSLAYANSGYRHSVAICTDGTMINWGANDFGQLGTGVFSPSSPTVSPLSSGPLFGRRILSAAAGHQTLVVAAIPVDGYGRFISNHPHLSNQTDDGDPDGDGLENLLEYSLGRDPSTPDATPIFSISHEGSDDVFAFDRSVEASSFSSQTFEWSSDLIDWHPLPVTNMSDAAASISTSPSGESERVEIRMSGPESTRFGRLRVERGSHE